MTTEFNKMLTATGKIVPAGAVEDVSRRRPNSKEFVLLSGSRKIYQTARRLHYDDGGLLDIDLAPVDLVDRWRIDQAPFILEAMKGAIEMTYTSRNGGFFHISSQNINIPGASEATVTDNGGVRINYDPAPPGLDIYFDVRPDRVKIVKVITGPAGPAVYIWNVEESETAGFTSEDVLEGYDSKFPLVGDTPRRRFLDLTRTQGTVTNNAGVLSYTLTETFNGRASEIIDPVTRARAWMTDLVYPVVIDG